MKNKNKLTLLQLKKQFEDFKNATVKQTEELKKTSLNNQINSHPTNIPQNTLKSSLVYVYLLSILSYIINKLPIFSKIKKISFIARILKFLGKSPFLTILVILRKGFILVNAIVGLFFVFNFLGTEPGSVMAGIAGMGTIYIELFSNFVTKLFNWFVDLFDYKIVPKPPTEPIKWNNLNPWSQSGWYSKPMKDDSFTELAIKAKDIYSNIPSLSDERESLSWTWTIFYIVGGAICLGALSYFGVKIYNYWFPEITLNSNQDPIIINPNTQNIPNPSNNNLPPVNPNIGPIPVPPSEVANNNGVINSFVSSGILHSMFNRLQNAATNINPLNIFRSATSSSTQILTHEQWLARQLDAVVTDYNYFPHTPVDPYDSFYERMRKSIFGETLSEKIYRRNFYNRYLRYGQYPSTLHTEFVHSPSPSPMASPMTVNNNPLNPWMNPQSPFRFDSSKLPDNLEQFSSTYNWKAPLSPMGSPVGTTFKGLHQLDDVWNATPDGFRTRLKIASSPNSPIHTPVPSPGPSTVPLPPETQVPEIIVSSPQELNDPFSDIDRFSYKYKGKYKVE